MFRGRFGKGLTAALCVLAVVAVLIIVSFFVPLYGQICSKSEYTGAKECASYHIVLVALWHITKAANDYGIAITALATAAVAVFTWTLYEATTEQGRLTARTIDLARQEFVSTHRPRIVVRTASIGSVLEGEPIGIFFTLANVGETPGRIMRSVVDVEVIAADGGITFGHNSLEAFNEIGDVVLAPGEERIFSFDRLNKRERSVTAPAWEAAKFGIQVVPNRRRDPTTRVATFLWQSVRAQEIYLGGQFLYADGAGTLRRTAFWRKLIPERQRFYRVNDEPDLEYAD